MRHTHYCTITLRDWTDSFLFTPGEDVDASAKAEVTRRYPHAMAQGATFAVKATRAPKPLVLKRDFGP